MKPWVLGCLMNLAGKVYRTSLFILHSSGFELPPPPARQSNAMLQLKEWNHFKNSFHIGEIGKCRPTECIKFSGCPHIQHLFLFPSHDQQSMSTAIKLCSKLSWLIQYCKHAMLNKLEQLLIESRVPWTARTSHQSILKADQSWVFIGRTELEAETLILWLPDVKSWLIWKDPDAGKDWRREKGKTEDELVGWHHRLNGCEFE